jgi:plastocyanin
MLVPRAVAPRPLIAVAFVAASLAVPAAAGAATHQVGVYDNYYDPKDIAVDQGDTVRWFYFGGGHDVQLKNSSGTTVFDSPKRDKEDEDVYTFSAAGSYSYLCTYHASKMRGTVVVRPAAEPEPEPEPEPTPQPEPEPEPTPEPEPEPTPEPEPEPTDPGTTDPGTTDPGTTDPDTSTDTTTTDGGDADQAGSDEMATQTVALTTPLPTAEESLAATVVQPRRDASSEALAGVVDAAPHVLRAAGSRGTLVLTLTKRSRVVLRFVRIGARHRVITRTINARAGITRLTLRHWLFGARYRASVIAFDAAGNMSKPVRLRLEVRR